MRMEENVLLISFDPKFITNEHGRKVLLDTFDQNNKWTIFIEFEKFGRARTFCVILESRKLKTFFSIN